MDSNTDNREPTEKQRGFLFKLIGEAGMDKDELETILERRISTMDKDDMSRLINTFVNYKDSDLLNEQLMKIADENPVLPPEEPQENKEVATQEAKEIKPQENKPIQKTEHIERTPLKVEKASRISVIAKMNRIPPELADMYFLILDGQLYIKSPGLLYMASKQGYARIKVTSQYDSDKKEWNATALVFPKIPVEVLQSFAGITPAVQAEILETQYGPTTGFGRASMENVKMSTMHKFLKEMAETRAVNRALRLFTGYGGTSYEELPESSVEVN